MDRTDLLALCRVKGVSWHFIAREAQRPGGLARLLAGTASEGGPEAAESLELLGQANSDLTRHRQTVSEMIGSTQAEGVGLTTVLDEDYPVNLRTIYNLPPFLFYRGELEPEDAYSVAAVGTREASPEGLTRARRMAAQLVHAHVTVLSGLVRGIDTAAHEGCLAAGGRTIAVLGSGIRRVHPRHTLATKGLSRTGISSMRLHTEWRSGGSGSSSLPLPHRALSPTFL